MTTYEVFTATFSKLIKADTEDAARAEFKRLLPDVEIVTITEYSWPYEAD